MVPMQSSSADALGMVERLLDEAKADRAAMEARLEAKDTKMEAKLAEQRQEMEAKLEATYAKAAEEKANMEAKMEAKVAELTAPAPAAISDDQVAALQARLEALNAAKLLSDEVRAPYSSLCIFITPTLVSSKLTHVHLA
jgi:DNA repair exonuclease SbcCD ATPase subunit